MPVRWLKHVELLPSPLHTDSLRLRPGTPLTIFQTREPMHQSSKLDAIQTKRRLLCALGGIICAVLVYALVYVPPSQSVAESATIQNYFIRHRLGRCRKNGMDECWMGNKCKIECGTRQVAAPCCYEGVEHDYVCEMCEIVVTPEG